MNYDKQLDDVFAGTGDEVYDRGVYMFDRHVPYQSHSAPWLLFGAGACGRQVLNVMRARKYHSETPKYFVDNNPALWDRKIDGLKVLSPSAAAAICKNSGLFINTVYYRGALDVFTQLEELGCKHVVSFLPWAWKYAANSLPSMTTVAPFFTWSAQSKIRSVFSLMGDDISKREFLAQLRLRLWGEFSALPPSIYPQYLPKDLFRLKDGEVVADCGAFNGDTVQLFLNHMPTLKKIFAMEPDPKNAVKLRKTLDTLTPAQRERVVVCHQAVGDTNATIQFAANGMESSGAIDLNVPTVSVRSVTLDSFLPAFDKVTFVKMDIEGHEAEALRGAKRLLATSQAVWAICAYHHYDDLWQLPALINKYAPEHKLYLRKYAGDYVLYAVPPSRCLK